MRIYARYRMYNTGIYGAAASFMPLTCLQTQQTAPEFDCMVLPPGEFSGMHLRAVSRLFCQFLSSNTCA